MTLKRTTTALIAIAAGIALLAGCSPTSGPQPTASSSSPTPTSNTAGPVDPPKDEAEAVKAAEKAVTQWLVVRGEVNAAGGKNTEPLKTVATGKALDRAIADATQISTGPVLNVDQKNVDGPGKTEGAIKYEPIAAYGQSNDGIENGLVTVNACQDASGYKVFASDGSPAMRPPSDRNKFDYKVIYDAKAKAWLVSDAVSLGQTC